MMALLALAICFCPDKTHTQHKSRSEMTLESFGFGLVPVAASPCRRLNSCLGRFLQRTAQDNELHKSCVDLIVHALNPRQCAHVFQSQITQFSAFATLEGTTLILFLSRGSIHQSNCWSNG
jgi:hypothetical protein